MHRNTMRVCIAACVLLAMLVFPQSASADPQQYGIRLVPISGTYNDLIEAQVSVEQEGTYYLTWNVPTTANQVQTFQAAAAGNVTAFFAVPEGARGGHKVHLIQFDNNILASADFEVFPTVQIAPDSGPAGTEVVVRGFGFSANETNIPVRFRGEQIGTAQADGQGTVDQAFPIPPGAGGTYPFEVGPDTQTGEVWRIQFSLRPRISVNPTEGVVGQTIQVSGQGFHSNETAIRVIFDGEVVETGISADANGSWTADGMVPLRPKGTYEIDASGPSTPARLVPEVEFTVGTGISVSPPSASVGDRVTVSGGGFGALEQDIRILLDNTPVGPEITADRDGVWRESFIVPSTPFGARTVSAEGSRTERADVTGDTLNILAALAVSPAAAAPGEPVTLTGSGFPSNQALTVTFGGSAVPESVTSLANGNLSAVVTVPANPPGALLVTAAGGGAEASADFTVQETELPVPSLISPTDGRRIRGREILFQWGRVTADHDVTYTLQIGNEDFTTISWSESGIQEEEYRLDRDMLERGDHYWRVRAVDEFGNQSAWSNGRSLRVAPMPVWGWVLIGVGILTILMVVAYREEKLRLTEWG